MTEHSVSATLGGSPDPWSYLPGFHNEHATEALPGTLPVGQFAPQRAAYGLYTEKFSSTAFTAPRASNRRTWFYRIRPSVLQGEFEPLASRLRCSPLAESVALPNQLRWDPLPIPAAAVDFVDGLVTVAVNGNLALQTGTAIHFYLANRTMHARYFYDADGELLLVPQQGRLLAHTECGRLQVSPGEILVIPRGMKFRIELPDGASRGYVCENHGACLRLPERGPVGSDGFANDRDFLAPVACYEEDEGEFELVCKFAGQLHRARLTHSPLDVVAWVGNSFPYKYDLLRFNVINSVSFDHPDPSIYTVLTSPSDTEGVANVDFVIFPPRWAVAEHTFRPPWYHRNVMSEFMGLIYGVYDAKETGFLPGGASLHNCMSAHGPDYEVFRKASAAELKPVRHADTLALMFESRYVLQPTAYALAAPELQRDYLACWHGIEKRFNPAQRDA